MGAARTDVATIADTIAGHPTLRPWAPWLLPAGDRHGRILHGLCALLIEYALSNGHVDVLADRGAAIWLDRSVALPRPSRHLSRRLVALAGSDLVTLYSRLAALLARGPGRAHLLLAVLAASTDRDAATLLAHRHQRLDRAGVTAYALAGTGGEQALLAAAGYLPHTPRRFLAGPMVVPMQRAPASRRSEPQPLWPPDLGQTC